MNIFIFLVLCLWSVPVQSDKYDVFVTKFSRGEQHKPFKVFLVPQTLPSDSLDRENYDDFDYPINIDHPDYGNEIFKLFGNKGTSHKRKLSLVAYQATRENLDSKRPSALKHFRSYRLHIKGDDDNDKPEYINIDHNDYDNEELKLKVNSGARHKSLTVKDLLPKTLTASKQFSTRLDIQNYDEVPIPIDIDHPHYDNDERKSKISRGSSDKSSSLHLVPQTLNMPKLLRSDRLDIEDYDELDNPAAINIDKPDYSYDEDLKKASRIVSGEDADIHLHPYHVGYGTQCSGAIIGSKWVLTAGHCGKREIVYSGSSHKDQGKITKVKVHHEHPSWRSMNNKHSFDYDFQILELEEHLNFNDYKTQPIRVGRSKDVTNGKMIEVTGWGAMHAGGPSATFLQSVKLPIVEKNTCQKVNLSFFRGTLTPRMFCAGYPQGERDACQGDSGGPAVANGRLLGLVSFGQGCACPNTYGVYSNVAVVRNWIRDVTGLTLN